MNNKQFIKKQIIHLESYRDSLYEKLKEKFCQKTLDKVHQTIIKIATLESQIQDKKSTTDYNIKLPNGFNLN